MSIYYSKRVGEKEISISFDKSEDFFKYIEWLDREVVEAKEIAIAPLEIKQDSEEESGWIKWEATEDFEGIPEGLHQMDVVAVKLKLEHEFNYTPEDPAGTWSWSHCGSWSDIVAYKIIKKYEEKN